MPELPFAKFNCYERQTQGFNCPLNGNATLYIVGFYADNELNESNYAPDNGFIVPFSRGESEPVGALGAGVC
jgi:hypothetical protein